MCLQLPSLPPTAFYLLPGQFILLLMVGIVYFRLWPSLYFFIFLLDVSSGIPPSGSALGEADEAFDRFFVDNMDLFMHMLPLECILCDAAFDDEAALHAHMGLHCFEGLGD